MSFRLFVDFRLNRVTEIVLQHSVIAAAAAIGSAVGDPTATLETDMRGFSHDADGTPRT